jgi:hypothetical protein
LFPVLCSQQLGKFLFRQKGKAKFPGRQFVVACPRALKITQIL